MCKVLSLRATLSMNLIFNFHLEKYFANNSSITSSWQVGNKYEIRSEKFNFLKNFLIRSFNTPGSLLKTQ